MIDKNDKDLTERVQKIFMSVAKGSNLPKNVQVEINDGVLYYSQDLNNEITGFGIFRFAPSLEFYKRLIAADEIRDLHNKEYLEELGTKAVETMILIALKSIHFDIEQAFRNFFTIPRTIISGAININTKPSENTMIKFMEAGKTGANAELKILFKEQSEIKIKSLFDEIINIDYLQKPVEPLFSFFYSNCLLKWKQAKKFFKDNEHHKNRQKMLEIGFEGMPSDLIERLADLDSYTSMPSAIALEHAARFCGFDDNSTGERTLQNYLKQSRDWKSKNGNEAQMKELQNYLGIVQNKVRDILYISELQETHPNLSRYPYIFRLVGEYLMTLDEKDPSENYESLLNYSLLQK